MIKFECVCKQYKTDFWVPPVKVLNDVSFEVPQGKITGFLGSNGSGKTTSIKLLLGLTRLDSGSITFSSDLGLKRKDILGNIGFLPERPYFYPNLTGSEFLYLLGRLSQVSKHEVEKAVSLWGKKLNIDYALSQKLRYYSKGMLQRIGFLSCLLHNPQLIVLDEPLSGLDPIGRREIKNVILDLKKQAKTIFFSSHIVSDIEEVCDHVVFINEKTVFYQGDLESLLTKYTDRKMEVQLLSDDIEKKISNLGVGRFDIVRIGQNRVLIHIPHSSCNQLLSECLQMGLLINSVKEVTSGLENVFYKLYKGL